MTATSPEDIPADPATLIRVGTIASVDLAAARCVVSYGDPDDEDGAAETPPIRWLAPRAGGTRVWSPPTVGEQVVLLTPDGQLGAAVALLGLPQDSFPPSGDDTVERIDFADGASFTYDPGTHSLEVDLPGGGTVHLRSPGEITIEAPAGVTIVGDVRIDGALEVSEDVTAEGDVTAGDVSLRQHVHTEVMAGGAMSGPPA